MPKPNMIINKYFGYAKTLEGEIVDRDGNPIPWYTYPAIEYLNRLDFSKCFIFEFGSGYSTAWWTKQAPAVIAIESRKEWLKKAEELAPEADIILCEDLQDYPSMIDNEFPEVVIVDGRERLACMSRAIIKEPKMIVLDNSDWFLDAAQVARQAGYIQVDFSGLGPKNKYTWTTSVFINRDDEILHKEGPQPSWGIGALRQRC